MCGQGPGWSNGKDGNPLMSCSSAPAAAFGLALGLPRFVPRTSEPSDETALFWLGFATIATPKGMVIGCCAREKGEGGKQTREKSRSRLRIVLWPW